MSVVAVPKHGKLGAGFSRRERFEGDFLHPGRRTDGRQSAATWITSLSDMQKVILLCAWCAPKFNPRKHGYRRFYSPDLTGHTSGYVANGMCDACKTQTALSPGGGTSFISEATYSQACQDPADARRRARQAWRTGPSTWAAVKTSVSRAWGSRRPSDASTGR